MNELKLDGILGPHADVHVLAECNSDSPQKAVILMHGRGSSGVNILRVLRHISPASDTIFLAPTANGNSWYPNRFLVPQKQNEPHLSSARSVLDALLHKCKTEYNIKPSHCILAGFSQGACLVSEYASHFEGRLGGLCAWSGGLIGDDNDVKTLERTRLLSDTPTYIGCDVADEHIPLARVKTTAEVLRASGARVELDTFSDIGHTIHDRGYNFLDQLLRTL